jgi:hypothetical protein
VGRPLDSAFSEHALTGRMATDSALANWTFWVAKETGSLEDLRGLVLRMEGSRNMLKRPQRAEATQESVFSSHANGLRRACSHEESSCGKYRCRHVAPNAKHLTS